jgi:hypothetical protein
MSTDLSRPEYVLPFYSYISSVSNLLSSNIINKSNQIEQSMTAVDKNMSNYVWSSSNSIWTYLQSTSNHIHQNIHNFNATGWQHNSVTNIIFIGSNIGIGTSQATEKLELTRSIHFTANINNTSSNQLMYMTNIRSAIQTQVGSLNSGTSNYVRNTSNEVLQSLRHSSNTWIGAVSIYNTNMSNFVRNSSNMITANVLSTSNVLLTKLKKTISSSEIWSNIGNNLYIMSDVIIGSNLFISENSLVISNSNLNIINSNAKKIQKIYSTSTQDLLWTPIIWYQFDNNTPVNLGILNDKNAVYAINYNLTIFGSTISRNIGFTTAAYEYSNAYFWNNLNSANPTALLYLVNYNQATGTDDSITRATNIQNLLKSFHSNNGFTINFLMKTYTADTDTPNNIVSSELFYIGKSATEHIIRVYIQNTTVQNPATKTLYFYMRYGVNSFFMPLGTTIETTLSVPNIKLSTQYIVTFVCHIKGGIINHFIYLNGILVKSSANTLYDSTYLANTGATMLQIGKFSSSSSFDAAPITLQDFRIYSRPMSFTDISSLKTSILNYTEPFIWYQFKENPTLSPPPTIINSSVLNLLTSNYTYDLTVMNNKLKMNKSTIFSYDLTSSIPVAWYQFNNGAIGIDSSGNSRNLFANEIRTEINDYIRGNACARFTGYSYFTGPNDINSGTFTIDNFTICCWCKLLRGESTTSYQTIATCRFQDLNSYWYGWSLHLYGGGANTTNLVFVTEPGNSIYENTDARISRINNFVTSTAVWKHVTVTMNKNTSNVQIYVDGVSQTSFHQVYNNSKHPDEFRIGASTIYPLTNRLLQNGSLIDDFRFYNRILTDSEIKSVIGYTLEKRTGKSNHPYSNAFLWDGDKTNTADNVYLENTQKTNIQKLFQMFHDHQEFSIHFVLQTNTNSINYSYSELFNIGNNSTYIVIYINDSNYLTCIISPHIMVSSTIDLLLNTFYNIDIVCNIINSNVNIKIYVDGVLNDGYTRVFSSYNNSFLISDISTLTYILGKYSKDTNDDASSVYIQDFRIFPSALSVEEITFLQYTEYNASVATISYLMNSLTTIVTSSKSILSSNLYPLSMSYYITSNYQIRRWNDTPSKYIKYTDGNVGIDKSVPSTKLHVGDGQGSTGSISYRYFSAGGNSIGSALINTTINTICSTFESSLLVSGKISAASDSRIKTNITDIHDDIALHKIMSIQPKTYEYIDQVSRGSNIVYGFIAQQIKEVIPEAVAIQSDVIPDVFKYASCTQNVITFETSSHASYAINTKLDIIDMNEQRETYTIINTDPITHSMILDKPVQTSNVFVYGSHVQDFHVLDKTYVYTLNVCSTQTLSEKIKDLRYRLNTLLSYYVYDT